MRLRCIQHFLSFTARGNSILLLAKFVQKNNAITFCITHFNLYDKILVHNWLLNHFTVVKDFYSVLFVLSHFSCFSCAAFSEELKVIDEEVPLLLKDSAVQCDEPGKEG